MASGQGFDLKQFLDQQRQEGQVDSAGAFTVAADKALKKLAKFSLPRTSDWVLKLVQAVNLWQSERLVVRQTRSATSFFFLPQTGADYPTDAGIVQALTTSTLDNQDPTQVLCMALRSLVEQVGLSFVLAIRQDGVLGEPIYAGDDTSQLDANTRRQWAGLSKDGVRLTVSHYRAQESFTGRYLPSFSRLERRDIDIAQHLEWDAFASPVPIYLDGRLITEPILHERVGYLPRYFRCLVSGTSRPTSGSPDGEFQLTPLSAMALAFHLKARDQQTPLDRPWFLMQTLEWRHLSSFYDTADDVPSYHLTSNKHDHRLFLVRQGVIVASSKFTNTSLASTISLFLPADAYRSDLIGLSVEISEDERQAQRRLKLQLSQALTTFREEFREISQADQASTSADSNEGASSDEQMKVGFSVFTESLATPFRRLTGNLGKTRDTLDNYFFAEAWKSKFFDYWIDLVLIDLETVARDLTVEAPRAKLKRDRLGAH